MYSWEDRIKAIELWVKYDKNLAEVVRELGYPSIKMLSIWCKAYLHEKETGSSTMRRQRTGRYSAEQKKRAVEYYFSHGRCLARTIRAVGYPCREVLAEWCEAVEPA